MQTRGHHCSANWPQPTVGARLFSRGQTGDILKINDKLQEIQQSQSFLQIKNQLLDTTNLLQSPLSLLTANGIQLKITDIAMLGIKPELSANGKDLQLRVPLTAKVSVVLPLLKQVLDLSTTVDLVGGLAIEKDPQTQQLKVALSKCSIDLDKLSISLLNRRIWLLNNLLDVTSGVLRTGVSFLLQNLVCPLIQTLVNSLNLSLGSDILSGHNTSDIQIRIISSVNSA
ncbi:BPI fold-containing family A member 2-like [Dipodomys spectabilis]|uniref:BPI fold-containing family A member 2-like n=1 Tax=Dipodomys spectabilis TaxID=105255 RepID=UPI001C536FEB|nr:BPI fold-containing family A member 2-like [Dipodomys spectabilis]